jgi:hypothetical protein
MKSLFYLKVIMMKTGIGDLIQRTEKHDISFLNYSSIKIDLSYLVNNVSHLITLSPF